MNAELAITFNKIYIRENLAIYILHILLDEAVSCNRTRRKEPSQEERTTLMTKRKEVLQNKIQECRPVRVYQEWEDKWINTDLDAALKVNIDT